MKIQNSRHHPANSQQDQYAYKRSRPSVLGLALLVLAVFVFSVVSIESGDRSENTESDTGAGTELPVKAYSGQPDPILAGFERDLNHQASSPAAGGAREADPVAKLVRESLSKQNGAVE